MASFELDRRSVAGSAVTPLGVVEHLDVVEDVGTSVIPRGVDLSPDALAFEQLEKALGHGVVVAVAAPAHAADQVVVAQEGLPLVPRELAALVGVHRHRLATLIDCKLHDRFAGQFRWDEQDGGKPQFKRVAHLVMPGPFALLLTARRFDPVQR